MILIALFLYALGALLMWFILDQDAPSNPTKARRAWHFLLIWSWPIPAAISFILGFATWAVFRLRKKQN